MPPKGAKRTKRAGKAEEPENVAYQKIEVSQNEVQLVACSSAPLAATSVGEKDSAIIDMVRFTCPFFSAHLTSLLFV